MADNTKKIAFLGKLVGIIFRLQEKMLKICKSHLEIIYILHIYHIKLL